MKKFIKTFTLIMLTIFLAANPRNQLKSVYPAQHSPNPNWVSQKMASLTLREKIAQFLMIRVYSNKDVVYQKQIDDLIKKWQIGGVCFFQGGPVKQAKLTNRWQNMSKIPMFVAIDAEWGLGMRLDSCFSYPYQMTMGAMKSDEVVFQSAEQIGLQLRRLGVHINFAPVLDINSNPRNPVINYRSFGEDKENVAKKGLAFIRGLHSAGIIATGKHFPGHGDTDSDSHYTLPLINHTESQIYETDLYPFKANIDAGLEAIMIAHLFVPALDNAENTASTLSHKIIQNVLRENLDFNGLVITDALDMKGVTQHFQPGEIEVKAFQAGNDILLLPQDAGKAIMAIEQAVNDGKIPASEIDARCRKILEYKMKSGLDHYSPVEIKNLYKALNPIENRLISRKIFRQSTTVVKNTLNRIPIQGLDTLNMAIVNIGKNEHGFSSRIQCYTKARVITINNNFDEMVSQNLIKTLDSFNLVVIGLNEVSNNPAKNYGISKGITSLISGIADQSKVILDIFGNPYALAFIEDHQNIEGIVISYDNDADAQDISAQIMFGAIGATGLLPVSINSQYPVNYGIETNSNQSLQFKLPEELGISSEKLHTIDSIASAGIKAKAYPGCQVLFVKDGSIFYQKSFGTFEWNPKSNKVKNDDIYDIASLTKILATIPSLIKLQDINSFSTDNRLDQLIPELSKTNKGNLLVKDILTHQARLEPWIRFYEKLLKDQKLNPRLYSTTQKSDFPVQVAQNLFISNSWRDTIYNMIDKSELLPDKAYKYSDLGYFYFDRYIRKTTQLTIDQFASKMFYQPLGLYHTGYRPSSWYSPEKIVPTENDQTFRFRQIKGFVHDPAAAMLDGVAGHAGVFSDALGVAVIMQMFLQDGYYGGNKYLSEKGLKEFTSYQFPENRRGLGFDKPPLNNTGEGQVCKSASENSFGHSGFTGTFTWADPENGLIYVFLSNRIYPDAKNNKINTMNIRSNIHEEMYKILRKSKF